ncbi:MAG: PilZ domain-containing protein, partial [Desulforhopalus sp.]
GGNITILNLSRSGARFQMPAGHTMEVGHKGVLVFTLDDRKKTALKKQVVIRTVKGNIVGCEFIEDRAFQKELGFYLLP